MHRVSGLLPFAQKKKKTNFLSVRYYNVITHLDIDMGRVRKPPKVKNR